ncbi:DUF2516 family protein [Nocardioides convexus]|uniref:DUF2516 family protein n=1 Tax=Nocardioides convexus TaxID=2712224 RepID=UPI00241817F5|nr:DUF2516 family protein [Nocardioides convexus]
MRPRPPRRLRPRRPRPPRRLPRRRLRPRRPRPPRRLPRRRRRPRRPPRTERTAPSYRDPEAVGPGVAVFFATTLWLGSLLMGGGWVLPASDVEAWINLGVSFALLVLKIFALVNALLYSAESYEAADKASTSATWCALLGIGVLLQVVPFPIGIVNLVLTVAAFVYLVDVRPALAGLRRRR